MSSNAEALLDTLQSSSQRVDQLDLFQRRRAELIYQQPQVAQRLPADRPKLANTARDVVERALRRARRPSIGKQRHAVEQLRHGVVQLAPKPLALDVHRDRHSVL